MTIHITFTNGSNPYIRLNMNDKQFRNELRKWKRNYNIVYGYWNGDILNISVSHKTPMQEAEMRKANKEYYQRMKRRARDTALCWQEEFAEKSMSWESLRKHRTILKSWARGMDFWQSSGKTEFVKECVEYEILQCKQGNVRTA